jgi:UDP-glucose 4-epimerase
MNIAIVGSNGFIGKNLINRLIKEKNINLFLFGRSDKSIFENTFTYTKINLNDSNAIINHFQKIDLIYYLASTTIPATSWQEPKKEIEENLLPFINFLDCISYLGIKKIIFTSSAGTIYGSSKNNLNENSHKMPVNPYGINKLTMENYLAYYDKRFNLKSMTFRISNIYGEHQNTEKGLGVVNTFLEKIVNSRKIDVYGDGTIIRNYIYINDVIEILYQALLKDFSDSNTYNLSSNCSLSINEIISEIKKVIKIDFQICYHSNRMSDTPITILDNTKLRQDFKIQFTPLTNGIKNILNIINK